MPESIGSDDYEVELDPQQPQSLLITHLQTGKRLQLSATQALDLLILMYRHREELRALRNGESQ